MRLRKGLILALFLCVSRIALGVGEQTGRLAGTVLEAGTGAPVAGATVTVRSPALIGGPRSVIVDDDGRYEIVELPPGKYEVEVSFTGVKPVQRRVAIRQGELMPLNISWSAELAETEVTVVTEERHMTRPDSTQTGAVLTAEGESKVAVNHRYQSIVGQVAGTVVAADTSGVFHAVKGGSYLHNRYLIDGMDLTDPVSQTWSANINFDSVASEEVLTGGMEAQYNALGAVVNLITAAGADEWHVDTSFYANNSVFSAPQKYGPQLYHGFRYFDDTPAPPTDSYQANLNVGGPLLKHRLWWNASLEYLYEEFSQPAGPPLNIQHPAYFRHQILARGKLTWAPNDRHRLTLSVSADPAFLNNVDGRYYGASNFQRGNSEDKQDQGGVFATLQWDYFRSQNINTSVQAGLQWSRINFGPQGIFGSVNFGPGCPNPADPLNCTYDPNRAQHYNINDGTVWYQGYIVNLDDRYTVAIDPSVSLRGRLGGWHDAKIGLQSRYVYHSLNYHVPGTYEYFDGADPTVANSTLEGGLCNEMAGAPGVSDHNCFQRLSQPDSTSKEQGIGFGLFIQDRWKPLKWLTLIPGIRVDYGWTQIVGSGKTFSSLFGIGPRVGATVDLTGDQKTIFSAFYGRSNETLSLLPASAANNPLQTTEQWNPTAHRWEFSEQVGGPRGYQVDRNLVAPHTDEVTASLRRELFRDSVGSIEYTYKKISNIWDGVEVNQIWDPTGYRVIGTLNGEARQVYRFSTPDGNYRVYHGIDFTVESRPTPNWDIWIAYTLSWLYGPGAEELGQVNGYEAGNSGFYNPRQRMFYDGYLADDHRHNLKVRASYSWKGLTIGGFFNYISGAPLSKAYFNQNDAFAYSYTNKRSPQGTTPGDELTGMRNNVAYWSEFRLPDQIQFDTRVQYDFYPLAHQHLIAMADLFNIFNLASATAIDTRDEATFGTAQGRQTPFRFQLGVRYLY